MEQPRLCKICNSSISHLRCDAKTCSSSCRGKLFRANKINFTLVHFQVPNDVYTNIAIACFKAGKGLSEYLTDMVIQYGK